MSTAKTPRQTAYRPSGKFVDGDREAAYELEDGREEENFYLVDSYGTTARVMGEKSDPEVQATARLLANAPLMYHKLRRLLDWAEHEGSPEDPVWRDAKRLLSEIDG